MATLDQVRRNIEARKAAQSQTLPKPSLDSGVTDFKQTPDGGATLNYQGSPMTLKGPTSGTATTKSTTSTATPQAEPVVTQTEVKEGIMSTNGGQAKEAYMTAEGTFDPNYIPKSEDEIFNLPIDEYTRQKYLSNFYNSQGANFDAKATPASFDEELKIFQEKQAKEKSALETQAQEIKTQAEAEKTSGQSANRANLTSGREGVTSQGNAMTRDQIDLAFESRYNSKMSSLQQQMEGLNQQMVLQQQGLLQGRSDQIRAQMKAVADSMAELEKEQGEKQKQAMDTLKMLSDNGALANLDPDSIKYLEDAMPGAPPGVVSLLSQAATRKYGDEQSKQKLEQATKGVTMMKDLVSSGVVLNNTAMMSFAQQTGLPLEAIMSFNMAAENVMNDKNLDQATKQGQLAKLSYELDRQARGITNAELEKVDYLGNMYRNGASPEEIAMTKKVMGIKDEDDPMYRADLEYKQAQTEYSRSQTAENYAKVQQAQRELLGMNGYSTGGYVPNQSLAGIKSKFENGKLIIDSKAPMQCGEFVNRFWGIGSGGTGGVGNTLASKTTAMGNRYIPKENISVQNFYSTVKPGMAFVTSYGSTGHIGVVTAVYPDGTYDTMEANVGDNNPAVGDPPLPRTRRIQDKDLAGFLYPPGGKASLQDVGVNSSIDTSNIENAIRNAMQGKAQKSIDGEVARMQKLVNEGKTDQARSMALSTVMTTFSTAQKDDFTALNNTVKTLDSVGDKMAGLSDKLGPANYTMPLYGAFGRDNQDLRDLDQQIKTEVQQYRKAMSGAAFTEAERREYEGLFPSITKTYEQNKTDMASLKNAFSQKRDSMLSTATGGAYNSLDEFDEAFGIKKAEKPNLVTSIQGALGGIFGQQSGDDDLDLYNGSGGVTQDDLDFYNNIDQ